MRRLTQTSSPLHFSDLGGFHFEYLVYRFLVHTEPNFRFEWPGQAGQDGGVDIIGTPKDQFTDRGTILALCANHDPYRLRKASEDLTKAIATLPTLPTQVRIFTGAQRISLALRSKVRELGRALGIGQLDIWSGPEFQTHLETDCPDLLGSAFAGSPTQRSIALVSKTNFIDAVVSRNEGFIGRSQELSILHHRLAAHHTCLTPAVSGMGGIGKTELAREYAFRYYTAYDGVWWVNATADFFEPSLRKLAVHLKMPDGARAGISRVRAHLLAFLSDGRHLLILDNVENLDQINMMRPLDPGKLLATTRLATIPSSVAYRFTLSGLTVEECRKLLNGNDETNDYLIDEHLCDSIAAQLRYHPLSLSLVASHLLNNPYEAPESLVSELLALRSGTSAPNGEHPASSIIAEIAQQMEASLTLHMPKISASAPAHELMRIISLLGPSGIPITYLSLALGVSQSQTKQALAELRSWSLLEATSQVSVHEMTQIAFRNNCPRPDLLRTLRKAIKAMALSLPVADFENWSECSTLLPHALNILQFAREFKVRNPEVCTICTQCAWYLQTQSNLNDAKVLATESLEIADSIGDRAKLGRVKALSCLGIIHRSLGEFDLAITVLEEAVSLDQTVQKQEPLDEAVHLDNLAGSYYLRGLQLNKDQNSEDAVRAFERAENLWSQAVSITEKVAGRDDLRTSVRLNNWALGLVALGKVQEAERAREEDVRIKKLRGNENSLEYAVSLLGLAHLYIESGRMDAALPLLKEAIATRDRVLPDGHPDRAMPRFWLGVWYRKQGMTDEARAVLSEVREARILAYGATHPLVRDTDLEIARLDPQDAAR